MNRLGSGVLLALLCVGCHSSRSSQDVWEDAKSAGRHMGRGFRALTGNHGDSRQIRNKNDFFCVDGEYGAFEEEGYARTYADDFVPLEDPCGDLAYNQRGAPPARETPGEPGSSIPGIEAFRDPATDPYLASIFRPVYFAYDSDLVKGSDNLQTVHAIASYLRSHPNTYVFVEGHTDERGPQAYNLALASRRANAVRNLLVQEGVNPDRLFTISYGKERPVILERHEEGWAKNRRDEFKVYVR